MKSAPLFAPADSGAVHVRRCMRFSRCTSAYSTCCLHACIRLRNDLYCFEMTYIVSGGALNSTHSLGCMHAWHCQNVNVNRGVSIYIAHVVMNITTGLRGLFKEAVLSNK